MATARQPTATRKQSGRGHREVSVIWQEKQMRDQEQEKSMIPVQ